MTQILTSHDEYITALALACTTAICLVRLTNTGTYIKV